MSLDNILTNASENWINANHLKPTGKPIHIVKGGCLI